MKDSCELIKINDDGLVNRNDFDNIYDFLFIALSYIYKNLNIKGIIFRDIYK